MIESRTIQLFEISSRAEQSDGLRWIAFKIISGIRVFGPQKRNRSDRSIRSSAVDPFRNTNERDVGSVRSREGGEYEQEALVGP